MSDDAQYARHNAMLANGEIEPGREHDPNEYISPGEMAYYESVVQEQRHPQDNMFNNNDDRAAAYEAHLREQEMTDDTYYDLGIDPNEPEGDDYMPDELYTDDGETIGDYNASPDAPFTSDKAARDGLLNQLAAPMKHQYRLQQTNPRDARKPYPPGTKGMFLAYIDARDLYNRLDQVIGFGNWMRQVTKVNPDGSVVGRLMIRIDGEWIMHEDVGYSNNPGSDHETEPLKAAASDAFKRAGVGLGVGRYLYDLDVQWHPIDQWGNKLDQTSDTYNPATQQQAPQAFDFNRLSNSPRGPVTTLTSPQNAPVLPPKPDNYNGATQKQLDWIASLERDIDQGELAYLYQVNDIDRMNLTGGRGGTASRVIDLLKARKEAPTEPNF